MAGAHVFKWVWRCEPAGLERSLIEGPQDRLWQERLRRWVPAWFHHISDFLYRAVSTCCEMFEPFGWIRASHYDLSALFHPQKFPEVWHWKPFHPLGKPRGRCPGLRKDQACLKQYETVFEWFWMYLTLIVWYYLTFWQSSEVVALQGAWKWYQLRHGRRGADLNSAYHRIEQIDWIWLEYIGIEYVEYEDRYTI